MSRIYLDHAATTPMLPAARDAVIEAMARWANPSSPHAEGRAARRALEEARARIKAALGWAGELIFTSGASEAIDLAMRRAKVTRRIVSAVEHDAVFRAAPDAAVVPVTDGELDGGALAAALAGGGPALVAIQHVNSETGTALLPFLNNNAVAMVRAASGLVLADCSQSAGKAALPDADMIVVSAHKLGGPPGVGALLVRDLAMLDPVGGHEFGYRMGTEDLPGILGFAAAVEAGGTEAWATTGDQRSDIKQRLWRVADVIAPGSQCGYILALAMPGMSATAQVMRFDALGFAVSAGSACSSGTLKRGRALAAFAVPDEIAARTIRVSMGWSTTPAELDAFAEAWLDMAEQAEARAA